MTKLLPAVRLVAWGEAFKETNASWLQQLGSLLRKALGVLGKEDLVQNGKEIMESNPSSWINHFVILQFMKPDVRQDEPHFDGGASLLHMGLTLWGRRRLDVSMDDDASTIVSFVLTPGNVYCGNMCAAKHILSHESDHDRSESFDTGDGQSLKVTAMLRTSLFGAGFGRILIKAPVPKVVYEIANRVVAEYLRDNCLKLPSFADCLAAEQDISSRLKTAGHRRTCEKKGKCKARRLKKVGCRELVKS